MAGRESSLTTAFVESKVANAGLSGCAAGAAGAKVGMALERYCWFTGLGSKAGAAGGGGGAFA